MPPANPTGRVTIDYRFVPAPHDLILDPHVSPLAFRLWCVLSYMDWTKDPPSIPILQKYLQQHDGTPPTRRSIYRWFGELESRGWLEWVRTPGKAGMNDRVIVKTRGKPVTAESQVAQPVIVGSQPVILRSQVVILRSQVDPLSALSEPPENATQKIQKIQKGGGGDAPSQFDQLVALFAQHDITQAEPLARLYGEKWPDVTVDQLTRLCERLSEPDAGSYAGARLYRKLKAGPYERPESRSVQSNDAPDRRKPSERIGERPALPPGLKLYGSGRKAADNSD